MNDVKMILLLIAFVIQFQGCQITNALKDIEFRIQLEGKK